MTQSPGTVYPVHPAIRCGRFAAETVQMDSFTPVYPENPKLVQEVCEATQMPGTVLPRLPDKPKLGWSDDVEVVVDDVPD